LAFRCAPPVVYDAQAGISPFPPLADSLAKNGMIWLQRRDGRLTRPIATSFAVRAIPRTFSIDADGVFEDQHVGGADIEGKLKKMLAYTAETQTRQAAPAAASGSGF
jgi:hypothetical protein